MHQRHTGTMVTTDFTQAQQDALPMALRIAIYRFIQEALNNAYQHGKGINQRVTLKVMDNNVIVEVSDQGPGFDIDSIDFNSGQLGLIGMRERIESMGGHFRYKVQ